MVCRCKGYLCAIMPTCAHAGGVVGSPIVQDLPSADEGDGKYVRCFEGNMLTV
jgi:hypothetical protein